MSPNHSSTPNAPKFEHSYATLPTDFFSPQVPRPLTNPKLIKLNEGLAQSLELDLDWLNSDEGLMTMAGNATPDSASPIAMAYSGHQFGHWNPTLGDGRAILLGEVVNKKGERFDFQLKGAGRTPYSRQGDGRSPLGPALREYIVSEAMAAMHIPTTRSLSVLSSGEPVIRDQILPGGILTRVAKSHIRIGTFEYAASLRSPQLLKQLADYTIERLYPNALTHKNPYELLLEEMIHRQALLVAQWQAIGFVHGVMNTDNILLSGETVDYGPCAFLDGYNTDAVFSSIDRNGRYAYKNQPSIAQWNLMIFAQTLLPLIDSDEDTAIKKAEKALNTFPDIFHRCLLEKMSHKVGLKQANEDSAKVIQSLLDLMQRHQMDFTLTFSRLTEAAAQPNQLAALFSNTEHDALKQWVEQWSALLKDQQQSSDDAAKLMGASNPLYIPRNHLVEGAITSAVRDDDLEPFHRLIDCLNTPYEKHQQHEYFSSPPTPDQVVHATFCGT